MVWEINGTDHFRQWYDGLDDDDGALVEAAVEILAERGPTLGRPFVDRIKGSRLHNLKELRLRSSNIRILFLFDPWQEVILLVGGDKTNRWEEWYTQAIPLAEQLYDDYLAERRQELT